MRTILGRVVDLALVRGLVLFEHLFPMPARLGAPLAERSSAAARHGDPVILIPGFANSASPGWDEWVRSLTQDGFDVYVVSLPTTGLGDMDASASYVADFIEQVRRRTGRSKVDLVGFSEGGLLARMAVAEHGLAGGVDRVITLASPNRGINASLAVDAFRGVPLLGKALPISTDQLMRGSEIVTRVGVLDRQLRLDGPVRYASIHSRVLDGLITPASASMEGMADYPVGFDRGHSPLMFWGGPTHFGMFHLSDEAYLAARRLLLDEDTPAPVADARAGHGMIGRPGHPDAAAATGSTDARRRRRAEQLAHLALSGR